MKKKIFLSCLLLNSLMFASEQGGFHKGIIKTQILDLKKDTNNSMFVNNLNDFEFKTNLKFKECMINNLTDTNVELFCLSEDSRSLFIELNNISVKENQLIVKNPFIIAKEINIQKIIESYK